MIRFENLNLQRHVRHKTADNSNMRYDLVQAIEVKDRVNVEDLSDVEKNHSIATADPDLLIMTENEYEKLQ